MTTDPAVTAAAEAIDGPGSTYLIQRGHVDIDDVARVVAAARPIIEAEARERIAAEVEAHCLATHGAFVDLLAPRPVVCRKCRETARIARGQS